MAGPDATWELIDVAAPQPRHLPSGLDEPGAPGAGGSRGGARGTAPRPVRPRRHAHPVTGAVDDGAATFQSCGRTMIVGAAAVLAPVAVLDVILARLATSHYRTFSGAVVSVPELIGGVRSATGIETLLAYLGIVAGSLATALVGGFAAVVSARRLMGAATRPGPCAKAWARHLPALVVSWLVGHSWIFVGSAVLVHVHSPGGVALVVVFGLPCAALLEWLALFAAPVIVVEGRGPLAALRRSTQMVRSRKGWAFSFLLLSGALGLGMRALLTLLPRLAQSTGLVTFGRWGGLAESIAGQLAQVVVIPLIGAATSAMYLQVRLHAEGMDLAMDARQAFG